MRPCTWTLNIPGWHPTPLNQLLTCHHMKAHRMKQADKDVIARSVMVSGVPEAIGRRRVDLLVLYPPGKRKHDPDAFWKSLNDSLVSCRALFADTVGYVQLGDVEYAKGATLRTIITITDM